MTKPFTWTQAAAFLNPFGKLIVSKANISKKLNSKPFRPPPTTNQPSSKWIKIIPVSSIIMVTTDAHFIYFSKSKQKADTTCDNLITQASNTPRGAKPIWFKYKFPKSFIPLLNIPGTLCIRSMMATADRSKKVLLKIFIGENDIGLYLIALCIGVCWQRAIDSFIRFVVVKFFKVETNRVSLSIFFCYFNRSKVLTNINRWLVSLLPWSVWRSAWKKNKKKYVFKVDNAKLIWHTKSKHFWTPIPLTV